jgi:hypothetical protein
VEAALRLLALTLVLACGCGGDSPSQAAPEVSDTTGVCGGEVGSAPSLCRLEVRPSIIGDGQAADVSFGLADFEGDISELCRLLTPVGGTPVSGACFEVTPVRGPINEIRTLERFLSAGDEDVRSLAPGRYVLSIRVHDRGGRSQPVRAGFMLTATPVPTPTPSPSPSAEPTPQPPPGVVLPPPRPLDGPLGGTVVFQVLEPEGPGGIFAIDPDGRNLRRLGGWSDSTAISLSGDGRRLAFMAPAGDAPGSDMEVWVVDTDGTNLRRLTYQGPTGLSSGGSESST